MMQPNQARKRNPTPSSNLVTSENDKDGSPTMTSMNVDVEGGANNSDNHMENNRTQQDEEREELLARYIRRRAKDVQKMCKICVIVCKKLAMMCKRRAEA